MCRACTHNEPEATYELTPESMIGENGERYETAGHRGSGKPTQINKVSRQGRQ